jgi:RNA recognition motif-containing protein
MGSEAEAKKAVEQLKGCEFDGRAMNVELVTPQESREDKPRRGGRRGGRGGRRNNNTASRSSTISKTVIYIGNLPYSASEEDLNAIFGGYNVVSARIVRRANGTSKGYGFVNVATEEDQARALAELVNVECDDRALHIKAAHSEEPYEERKKSEEESA